MISAKELLFSSLINPYLIGFEKSILDTDDLLNQNMPYNTANSDYTSDNISYVPETTVLSP